MALSVSCTLTSSFTHECAVSLYGRCSALHCCALLSPVMGAMLAAHQMARQVSWML
jgi:hypothetical protein